MKKRSGVHFSFSLKLMRQEISTSQITSFVFSLHHRDARGWKVKEITYCSDWICGDKLVEQHVFLKSVVFLWDNISMNEDFHNNSDRIDNRPWRKDCLLCGGFSSSSSFQSNCWTTTTRQSINQEINLEQVEKEKNGRIYVHITNKMIFT